VTQPLSDQAVKLTKAQREMLLVAEGRSDGITKSEFRGSYWRVIDALQSRGLVSVGYPGRFHITAAGRLALSHTTAAKTQGGR
jgi:hypothetical protein